MKYRKKPVVVEAEVYRPGLEDGILSPKGHFWPSKTPEEIADYKNWLGANTAVTPVITTLEGYMKIAPGDYVITGVQGERYPCKPDIFEATYEPVTQKEG